MSTQDNTLSDGALLSVQASELEPITDAPLLSDGGGTLLPGDAALESASTSWFDFGFDSFVWPNVTFAQEVGAHSTSAPPALVLLGPGIVNLFLTLVKAEPGSDIAPGKRPVAGPG